MKLGIFLGVLGVLAAPAMADPYTYTFDLVGGSTITLDADSTYGYLGTTDSNMTGTFAVKIYETDGHIDVSDTFTLGKANVTNEDEMQLYLEWGTTATISPGSARFLDFDPNVIGHIQAEPNVISTDVYAEATAIVAGLLNTTFITAGWAGEPLDFLVYIESSVDPSGTIHATIEGKYTVLIDIELIGPEQITLDLIVDLEATAHAHAPEPALSGLAFLGLTGAGAWLRRRRR